MSFVVSTLAWPPNCQDCGGNSILSPKHKVPRFGFYAAVKICTGRKKKKLTLLWIWVELKASLYVLDIRVKNIKGKGVPYQWALY